MATDGTPSPADPPPEPEYRPAQTLGDRTFVGLLIAQFLAAFNDQAIHASAMFFAINTGTLTEAEAISLMPILFYAPWAIFCTVAGWLADRYSKRYSLVFWKFSELVITAIALAGFWLGNHASGTWQLAGPWVVLATVFLMGTHSAFFVPAKYGVMPEILPPHLLSRGNGWLESLSFLAIILGTVAGGVMSYQFFGREEYIGLMLFGLAVVGSLASLLIRWVPAANPRAPFPPWVFGSLYNNLKVFVRLKPLRLALIGIAFFTFVVAYMRSTMYMLGESQNPKWTEMKTSIVVGTVALGIGLGSPLAGYLSGRKVELGLIPLGAVGMVLSCVFAAWTIDYLPGLVTCIILIGVCTGFYLVPLYTLLQHRAPKTSKGNMVATSNFVNVTGAIAASLLFFLLVTAAQTVGMAQQVQARELYTGELVKLELHRGRPVGFVLQTSGGEIEQVGRIGTTQEPVPAERFFEQLFGAPRVEVPVIEMTRDLQERAEAPGTGETTPGSEVAVRRWEVRGVEHYELRRIDDEPTPHFDQQELPRFLLIGAGVMTLLTLMGLMAQLPDLLRRTVWFARSLLMGVRVSGMKNLPATGPVVLVTNTSDPRAQEFIASAADRRVLFVAPGKERVEEAARWLERGDLVGVADGGRGPGALGAFLAELRRRVHAEMLPVYFGKRAGKEGTPAGQSRRHWFVVFGPLLPPEATLDEVLREVCQARDRPLD